MYQKIKEGLKDLGFSKKEIKIYISLTKLGESTASKVAKSANLPRTTVIGILNKLCEENYISSHWYRKKKIYWIESPKNIEELFQSRVKIAKSLGEMLDGLYHSEADFPHSEIYDTQKGIRGFIEKKLISLEKNSIIYTIDTPGMGNYEKIYSGNFENSLMDLKSKRGIITNTLIPHGLYKIINPKKLKQQKIFIREMPEKVNFKASLWIINNNLVLFSGRYPYIVSVQHSIITQSVKSIFDFLWEISIKKI